MLSWSIVSRESSLYLSLVWPSTRVGKIKPIHNSFSFKIKKKFLINRRQISTSEKYFQWNPPSFSRSVLSADSTCGEMMERNVSNAGVNGLTDTINNTSATNGLMIGGDSLMNKMMII